MKLRKLQIWPVKQKRCSGWLILIHVETCLTSDNACLFIVVTHLLYIKWISWLRCEKVYCMPNIV